MYHKRASEKIRIVIVGGGFGGLSVLNGLSNTIDPRKHEVILIDARPEFIHLPATLRLTVSDADDLITHAMHPYGEHTFRNKLAGNAKYIHGSITDIKFGEKEDRGVVVLDSGEDVHYDILVLATGSIWPRSIYLPTESRKTIEEFIKTRREEYAKASDILLVGGGAVGIELAGELRDLSLSKNITILHRGKQLLNSTYSERYRIGHQQQLESRNITVITGDSLTKSDASKIFEDHFTETELVTEKGRKLKVDLVIPTWGARPNTSYLPPNLLSSTGYVQVLPTLQLPGHPNIFALGDIIDWDEQKSARKAANVQAPKVQANIIEYLQLAEAAGESSGVVDLAASRKSAKYAGGTEMSIITNGKV
ncbi:hypothetical protein D9757_008355 [Collybiopsis confluens]|uniref:FAD/NAD(P)-binding domain-containing protein n=1 Tax=Collybiopsis confluens TaxID=2823264 RepID=A0A8H5HEN1_9AGAR|nr:hypothetical protein D9757_008355 [Collybiopsis confluens]